MGKYYGRETGIREGKFWSDGATAATHLVKGINQDGFITHHSEVRCLPTLSSPFFTSSCMIT